MDNLNSCFFCLQPLSGFDLTQRKRTNVFQFFEMAQRHVDGSSTIPVAQLQAADKVNKILSNGNVWPCSECLSVLKAFNKLYDQLKTIELRTNMTLAKVGDIMKHAIKESVKSKANIVGNPQKRLNQQKKKNGNVKLTIDKLNWARRELQFKYSNQLTTRFPLVTVKRCKPDATMKLELPDDMQPNPYMMTMTTSQLDHEPVSILLAMASLKLVLELSLINATGIKSSSDCDNNKELSKNPREIPVDDNNVHQLNDNLKSCDAITRTDLNEYDKINKSADDAERAEMVQSSTGVVKCHRCEKSFDNFSSLKYHWLRCDLTVKPSSSQTPISNLVTLEKSKPKSVLNDKEVDHSVPDNKAPVVKAVKRLKKFSCAKCSKVFNFKNTYKNHCLTHSDPSTWPYSCSVCVKRFIWKHCMQIHVLKIHPNDPVAKSIRLHLQSGIKQRKLSMPKPKHHEKEGWATQTKNYICQECGKDCQNSTRYNYHLKIHAGPESWKHWCSYCEKRFIYKHDHDKHLRTHTKEKPYQCLKCDEKFAFSKSRMHHMLIWHGPVS